LPGDRLLPIEGRAEATLPPLQARGTATVVSLEQVADETVGSVRNRIALRTQRLRELVAGAIMFIFVVANGVTLWIVLRLVDVDQGNIAAHLITPADRIITNQVIMTLLGGTAVQVGAIAVIIAQYLFPGSSAANS
jgi:hypothetical protein